MTYELYRMPEPCADIVDGVRIGEFDTFDDALEARDDDAVVLLASASNGQALLVCHQIVGPDANEHVRPHPVTSEFERHIDSEEPGRELAETREWLARIHRRT
jgi:hypothetical protein